MKKYELHVEGYYSPLTADQIAELFRAGRLRRSDRCREVDAREWRTIDELFPLLKYDSSGSTSGLPPARRGRVNSAFDGNDEPGDVRRPISSALKAGWICFGIGLAISWFFPLGHAFFSVALITSVVAMCTHQVNRGLALLVSSFVAIGLCTLIFFTLVLGTIGVATGAALTEAQKRAERQQAQQRRPVSQSPSRSQTVPVPVPIPVATPVSRTAATDPKPIASTFEQRQQYELAMQQQRQADAQKAADERQQRQAVREAERQRDRINAKEASLQQLQKSIDWNDRMIRQANEHNVNPKVFQDQRDSLLHEKAKLQGY